MFEHAPIGKALVALDGPFLRVNPALCRLTGFSEAELLARTLQDITHPDDLAEDLANVASLLDGPRDGYEMEKRYLRADGEPVWVQLSCAVLRDDEGRPLFFITQMQDISRRREIEAQLRELAEQDALTGLPNRRRFDSALASRLVHVRRYGGTTVVAMVDVDDFKPVNDVHGHAAGDAVLIGVAGALRARLRQSDLVARVGGDEFALILPEIAATRMPTVVAEICEAIGDLQVGHHGVTLRATASFGAVCLADGSWTEGDALARADDALYAAKAAGGDASVVR